MKTLLTYRPHAWHWCLVPMLAALLAPPAHGVAYCALRDPVNTIYALFPDADGYRSSVKTVGREARETVLRELPFTMHFNELGRHTLYIVRKDGATIGYVHARSEMGEWGLTEYAWGLTPDLTIKGVKVQRSRDPQLRGAASQALGASIAGRSLQDLKHLHTQTREDAQLRALLRSAMKTIVITQYVWQDELLPADPLSIVQAHLPQAARLVPIEQLYDAETLHILSNMELSPSPIFERDALSAFTVNDGAGQSVALAVASPLAVNAGKRMLLWIATPDGSIKAVRDIAAAGDDPDFSGVVGFTPTSIRDCSTLADLAALEIATLARRHLVN